MENTRIVKKRNRNNDPEKEAPTGPTGKSGIRSLWKFVVLDIVTAAVILGIFYLFLNVIPQYRQYQKLKAQMELNTSQPTPIPEVTDDTTPKSPQTSSPTFQDQFSSWFTDEVIMQEDSYSSPDVAVTITRATDVTQGSKPFSYYVADIHVSTVEGLQAGFPSSHVTETVEKMAKDNHAVLGINGDFYLYIHKGLIIRNGIVLQADEGTNDICVLYRDGRMETLEPGEYTVEDILDANPYQVWSFGPELLDAEGLPKEEFNTSSNVAKRNPRTAIGYYEPGHYCFVVVDGRKMNKSSGASMSELSALMKELGCKAAYNFDGGDSSSMVFNGKPINRPSGGGRAVSDIVMIRDLSDPA